MPTAASGGRRAGHGKAGDKEYSVTVLPEDLLWVVLVASYSPYLLSVSL